VDVLKRREGCELDSTGLGLSDVSSVEHGNKPWSSLKDGELLDQLSDINLLKRTFFRRVCCKIISLSTELFASSMLSNGAIRPINLPNGILYEMKNKDLL
jgi:hypothetical protein